MKNPVMATYHSLPREKFWWRWSETEKNL